MKGTHQPRDPKDEEDFDTFNAKVTVSMRMPLELAKKMEKDHPGFKIIESNKIEEAP